MAQPIAFLASLIFEVSLIYSLFLDSSPLRTIIVGVESEAINIELTFTTVKWHLIHFVVQRILISVAEILKKHNQKPFSGALYVSAVMLWILRTQIIYAEQRRWKYYGIVFLAEVVLIWAHFFVQIVMEDSKIAYFLNAIVVQPLVRIVVMYECCKVFCFEIMLYSLLGGLALVAVREAAAWQSLAICSSGKDVYHVMEDRSYRGSKPLFSRQDNSRLLWILIPFGCLHHIKYSLAMPLWALAGWIVAVSFAAAGGPSGWDWKEEFTEQQGRRRFRRVKLTMFCAVVGLACAQYTTSQGLF